MSKARSRQRAFAELQEPLARGELNDDSDAPPSEVEDDAASSSDEEDHRARDHYVPVGKSKLRAAALSDDDPRYKGAKVRRDQALSDDEGDPFAGLDGMPSDEGSDSDQVEDSEEDEQSDTEGTEMSEQEHAPIQTVDREELRRAVAADRTTVNATILAAAKSDAEKGRAVKRQRTTYDSLLNVRIKMQKSLIATNSLAAVSSQDVANNEDLRQAADQAETAAFDLWSRLNAYRLEISKAQLGSADFSSRVSSGNASLVKVQQEQEAAVKANRDAVLHKWSMKSRSVTVGSQQGRLNTEQPATIVDVLNEQLSNTDRLLQRARTPRSCAPVQVASRVVQDEKIYDDADFYGLLLKELLEAKSSASASAAANIDIKSFISIKREAKTRKNVDTKASKGRKLKYTVHEKLQNFCAPDDRSTWTERQRDELFSSLFGQRIGLKEDQASSDEASDTEMRDAGLMMFRNGT